MSSAQNSTSTNAQDHELVAALHRLSKKSPKLVRSTTYPAPADAKTIIRSWKMNEFKYYDVPSPFPTLARGLFTRWEGAGEEGAAGVGKHRIVARGYDKFFNIGEVPWTSWKALEAHTAAPYHLTLKSNGCIIFVAALTESALVITSKHSLGPIKGQDTSHALAGEAWLRKHLHKAGRTEQQLAKTLWDNNWTAVAELCDDDFEEHVLPIAEGMAGLHLHGLNHTTGAFQTREPAEVTAFAHEWGFIPTAYTTLDSAAQVREFTEDAARSGTWNGQPIEGFVVRTHIAAGEGARDARDAREAPPYPPSASFFFKVKFDEPYMMYRDWREITKILLSVKPGAEPRISKAKLGRLETRRYKEWVEREIKSNRAAFEGYTRNKGIIATRERFLAWCEAQDADKDLEQKPAAVDNDAKQKGKGKQAGSELDGRPRKTVIVPIAIPGCGKTSIAVALTHLFGFGHTQSDDIKAKRPAPVFLQSVVNLLLKHDVVIADKNNHMVQHRRALRTATCNMIPPARLIALNWSLESPPAIIHRICSDRIQARGENHQSLRPDEQKAHEDVLWMFMDQAEGLGEHEVDEVIEMDVEESLEDGLSRAVSGLVGLLGLERPSEERMAEAFRTAVTYRPTGKKQERGRKELEAMQGKEAPAKKHSPGKPPRYYGLLPELDLEAVIGARLAAPDATDATAAFWEHLKAHGRVAERPHVTLVHSKNRPTEGAMWDRCTEMHRLAAPPTFSFRLGHLVHDARVMALTVEDLAVDDAREDGTDAAAGAQWLKRLPEDVRERLHVTVGTHDRSVNPVEAKGLVESWRRGAKVAALPLDNIQARGRIKGLY